MQKRTREILAIALLLVLGLAVGGAMAWYIFMGHNWNQAATRIDDMVGSMDGYTVIAFEGVAKKTPAATMQVKGVSGTSRSSSEGDGGSVSLQLNTSESATKDLDVNEVAASYRDKGASVLVLSMKDLGAYGDPTILSRGGRRIGIFSFTGKYRMHYAELRSKVRYLQRHKVDFILGIVSDKSIMTGAIFGIDVLILNRDAGIPEAGELHGSTLCIDSPFEGEAQTLIISPSGVMTSRTVKEIG